MQGPQRDYTVMVYPKIPTSLQLLLGQIIHLNGHPVLLILRMTSANNYTKQAAKYENKASPRLTKIKDEKVEI